MTDTTLSAADGRPTRYALGCGYVDAKSTDPARYRDADLYTELYREHDHYHVRQFDRRPGAPVFRTMWEVFSGDEYAAARALFDAQPGPT